MQTIVIYSSQTGNTRKLATQIFAAIPGDSKDLKNIDEYREKDAELYFVGFWVDRGDCDEKTVRSAWQKDRPVRNLRDGKRSCLLPEGDRPGKDMDSGR